MRVRVRMRGYKPTEHEWDASKTTLRNIQAALDNTAIIAIEIVSYEGRK